MSDPRFQSVHLTALPRREEYRRARARIQNACGDQTIAGCLLLADPHPPADAPTIHPDALGVAREAEAFGEKTLVCYLQDRDRIIELKVGLNTIGRLPDNDIVIDDASVSRRHCAILVHSDLTAELHDTASKNGTTINGSKLIGPTRLKSGDVLALCDRQLTFCRAAQLPPKSPSISPKALPPSDQTLLGPG